MIPDPHRLPEELLTAIAAGAGGPEAVRALAAVQHSRNRMLTLAVVELARRTGHREAAQARRAYQLLAEIEQVAPVTVRDLLCYPTVAAWLSGTVSLLRGPAAGPLGPGPVSPGALWLVAAAAAVRARLPVRIPSGPARRGRPLILPSLGQAWLPDAEEALDVRVGPDAVRLCRAGHAVELSATEGVTTGAAVAGARSTGWVGLPRLSVGTGGSRFVARLDGPGWQFLPAGGADRRIVVDQAVIDDEMWRRRVDAGWRLLARHHRPVAREAALAVTVLAPLREVTTGMVSGTFREAFGAVAMSLPPDARSVAVTLAHELQHTKLIGVMDSFPLVEPGVEDRFYAPWRDDPRPLGALLHGTYAHLGVAAFWRTQRLVEETVEDAFAAQVAFARWRVAAWEATEVVLGTRRLTPVGELMLDGMRATLRRFLADPVPTEALRRADLLAERHRRKTG